MNDIELDWIRHFALNCDPFWLSRQTKESYKEGLFHELDFLMGEIDGAHYKEYIAGNLITLYETARAFHGLKNESLEERYPEELLSKDR